MGPPSSPVVVSGGQTGVDRAALDVALRLGLACGGWCPAGRWAEDGTIPDRYPLRTTPLADPAQRTEWNVRDSDATLILSPVPLAGGTARARECCERLGRPFAVFDPFTQPLALAREWMARLAPRRLNVAGPRESEAPGVYLAASRLLGQLLAP